MGGRSSKDEGLTALEKKELQEAKKRSEALERELQQQNARDLQIHKLLLLGAGESGKSTLFKQMITIYGKGFPDNERKTFVPTIHNNVIMSMKTLCDQSDRFGEGDKEFAVRDNANAAKRRMLELKDVDHVDSNVAQDVQTLWADAGIQTTYAHRSKFQLTDSAAYFFNQLNVISRPDYLPSQQDVLRSRVRTTGIVENSFEIEGNTFKMFDVGGQRNERKKWIHCFSEVTAVLFVAALSEYDQVLFEDDTMNRMDEALALFEEISNSKFFKKTSMILFLNKKDLFAEKITKVPLTVWKADYSGENNYEQGVAFIEGQFLAKHHHKTKQIYTHLTCATDTATMKIVFNAVKDIVIRKTLQEGGLLV